MTPRWQVKDVSRFWSRVEKRDRCWLWSGCRVRGYGHLRVGGVLVRAHRFAWEVAFGPVPPGHSVCHHCDNPACVNPGHLFLGTHAENMRDMAIKGRSCPWPGESNPRAKLTADEVAEIRRRPDPRSTLAREFGVSLSLISAIRNRRVWR